MPRVPFLPPIPSRVGVESGRSVSGRTWRPDAGLVNHLLGHGGVLVPSYAVGASISVSNSKTFRFRVWPRVQAIQRLWSLHVYGGKITVNINGTDYTREIVGTRVRTPHWFIEEIASPTDTEQEITITVTADTGTVTVDAISCRELPRIQLEANATEYGVGAESLAGGLAIYDPTGGSYGGVAESVKQAETTARRNTLIAWSVDDADALTTTSTSAADVFILDPIVLARKERWDDVVGVMTGRIRAKCSDGTTSGEVVITMTSGDTVTLAIPTGTTSWSWLPGSGGEVDVDAEDSSTVDGRRGSAWDLANIQWRRTAGSGTVSLSAITAGEAS